MTSRKRPSTRDLIMIATGLARKITAKRSWLRRSSSSVCSTDLELATRSSIAPSSDTRRLGSSCPVAVAGRGRSSRVGHEARTGPHGSVPHLKRPERSAVIVPARKDVNGGPARRVGGCDGAVGSDNRVERWLDWRQSAVPTASRMYWTRRLWAHPGCGIRNGRSPRARSSVERDQRNHPCGTDRSAVGLPPAIAGLDGSTKYVAPPGWLVVHPIALWCRIQTHIRSPSNISL